MNNLIKAIITDRRMLSSDVVSLTLAHPDGAPLPAFSAGAHISVHVNDDTIRQYSLCSAPTETAFYRLGILKDPKSRGGSIAIHEQLNVGDTVTISAPNNLFPLDMTAEHSVLAGGGIGITPMIAMAYALKAAGKSFTLHYCVRTHKEVAFLDELQRDFGDALRLHCDDLGDDQRLRPDIDFGAPSAGTHIYTCGPTGFMDWVMSSAKAMGFAERNIHFEYFNVDVDSSGEAFTVVAEQSGKTISVSGTQTIVQALSEAGIKVQVSCEQGICGTCIVDVLEGEPDHRDQFLTDEEKADNDQIAVCCSRAKSSVLVLDI
ncbi:PDR/VanB family oxidoreductase [Psychrobacter aestuarii]|uniref:PDR/VanB family oxidoreductase n=1 Tax=Psychrobacter aestuarii TaxID=556327 RepID=A0ABP3FD82_9GAMM|nr:PDR/VanB family oxidoreductase [Psychrobacter aestuarii]